MYLPQFHAVKENNEWWGEGFTDWVSTRNAIKLFENHYQPHVPLNEYYYDLLQKETMIWQANLMKQYGIDGACMYHYWFKDGRQILEKPAENLLRWQDVDMPYCFCWANETWARSWSKMENVNVWTDLCEGKKDEQEKAILLEQKYGEEKEWKSHFDYLNQFFLDDRYIKLEGKPVFIIYKASMISCLNDMILYWQDCAKKAGWPGIYIIGGDCKGECKVDAEFIREPGSELGVFEKEMQTNGVTQIDYAKLWKCILDNQQSGKRKTYYSGIVGYDDTPRRGKRGLVLTNNSPELFKKYLIQLLAKSERERNEMVFINAWNEWGEGMHLEPDQKYKYEYLIALKEAKSTYLNYVGIEEKPSVSKKNMIIKQRADKYELYMNTLDEWLRLEENDICIGNYFINRNIKKIGIYGYSMFAKHLIVQMKDTDVEISFLVDKQKDKLNIDIPVFLPEEALPKHDILVVTSFFYYDEIKKELGDKYKMISLQEVIFDCPKEDEF